LIGELEREGKKSAPLTSYKADVERAHTYYVAAVDGFDDAQNAIAPPALKADLSRLHAQLLARQGMHAEAAVAAELVRAKAPNDAINLIAVARVYGLCVAAVTGDASDLRNHYARAGIAALRQSLRINPALAKGTPLEPDIHPLFDHPAWAELVSEVVRPALTRPSSPAATS